MLVENPSTPNARERAPRATLSHHDHAELEWYFGVAPARFERSTSGGIFDHIANSSPSAIRDMGFEYCTPKSVPVLDAKGDVIGRISARDAVTARITAEHQTASGFEPDDNDRTRFARISRRVRALAALEHGAVFVEVMRAYFGDSGNAWAQLAVEGGAFHLVNGKALKKQSNSYAEHASHGRIGALYVLVRGGQMLLRYVAEVARKKGQPDLGFTDDLRMRLEVCSSKGPERKALLTRARAESLSMFTATVLAWNTIEDTHGR